MALDEAVDAPAPRGLPAALFVKHQRRTLLVWEARGPAFIAPSIIIVYGWQSCAMAGLLSAGHAMRACSCFAKERRTVS